MTNFLRIFVTLCLLSFPAAANPNDRCARGYADDDTEALASGANDIIVVQQRDGTLKSTQVQVQVSKKTN